jgi:hypothetical protein
MIRSAPEKPGRDCARPVANQTNPRSLPATSARWAAAKASAKQLAERDLARSGLTLASVEQEGVFPIDDASSINPDFAPKPALIFTYRCLDGQQATFEREGRTLLMCRARYLPAPGQPLPKGRKYDQPTGSGVQVYFPRGLDVAALVGSTIAIVEGEKKAIALTRAGMPCIGLGGVDCFRQSGGLHPELAAAVARCSRVYIAFDSDIETNENVQAAEWRLTNDLALLGLEVHCVRLPASDMGGKVGVDDYLVTHGPDALEALFLATPSIGERLTAVADHQEAPVSDILAREVTPVEELIPQWVQKGVTNFLAGAGGSHKSRLAMQWGLCLNAGADDVWGGKYSLLAHAPACSLVYYSAADGENELARRAQAIAQRLKIPKSDRGLFVARQGKDSALVVMREDGAPEVRPFYHQMKARLQSIEGHKLVVLDSAYDFVRFAGRAKIDEDAVNYFIKVILQGICDATDSTLLIPWHPSQAGSNRGEMDGWSVAWHNAPRARLAIGESKDVTDAYELKAVKRNHAAKGAPLTLKFDDGALVPNDAIDDSKQMHALREACVGAANHAADMGVPIKRQPKVSPAIVKRICQEIGRTIIGKQVKDELEAACLAGELEYREGRGKQKAGYFPRLDGGARSDLGVRIDG